MKRFLLTLWVGLLPLAVIASPQPGDAAPDFHLQDQHGDWHQLSDYQGNWLVMYFYPKNDTPGCTTEACNFRDNLYLFERIGVEIVGVSLDDVESHQAFAEKYQLPFTLLSDNQGDAARSFGVLAERGATAFARRETFVIDPDGVVWKHYRNVNPETHTDEVVADLNQHFAEDAS